MLTRDLIQDSLKNAIGLVDINLETPENEEFGDYSTNVAFLQKGRNPKEVAEEIIKKLKEDEKLSNCVERLEVAGSGFINFWLKKDVLLDNLIQIDNEKGNYGKSEAKKGKKVVVEFTDPNPFKEFHVGHLYSNTIGESLARLQEFCGAQVWRADYFGDAGVHVAKAIWGLRKKMQEENISLEVLSQKSLKKRIEFMGQAYALGSSASDADQEVNLEIERLNTVIYLAAQKMWKDQEGKEPVVNYDPQNQYSEEVKDIYETYVRGRSWSLDYFETIYKRLGTKFDGYYPESVVGEIGYKYVMDNLGKVFDKSDGAVVYKGEKVGLHTRVFINKHNLPTYEAKELGLAPKKYEDFKYDESIIVTGNEINEYFKVLIAALKEINPNLGEATVHIGHGMVRLPEGKMSSRSGKIITGEEVLDEIESRVLEIIAKSEIEESEKVQLAEKVAVGAVKYSFLKNSIGQDLIFDFEKSLSLEGNSGPYLQYTIARTNSVLGKAPNYKFSKVDENLELDREELSLLRSFIRSSGVIESAAKNYSPNILCNYLYDLAQKYNSFYSKEKILGSDKQELRLNLTKATGQILKNGLQLLGIQAPERM